MFDRHRSSLATALLLAGLTVCLAAAHGIAAEKQEIEQAIERGKAFLLKQSKTGAHGSLCCYALVKAGVDKQHPDIQKCVAEVVQKCQSKYNPMSHNYEAGVDAMLLEAIDREKYKPQLTMISQYLVYRQRPYGGWYYPTEGGGANDFGDTSISQYAILGLWATARADVEVPTETWERAAKWLLLTQRREGGFGYHPLDPTKNNGSTGGDIMGTMTVAGTGSLLVIRHVLFRDSSFDEGVRPATATRRFGILERPTDEKEKPKASVRTNPTMSVSTFDKALKEAVKYTSDHFADGNALGSYGNYYYYGVERVAALLDVEKLGSHDWYGEGADDLLRKQANDGSWNDSCGQSAATALTLLFLTKATAGTINKPKKAPVVGGGLLVGGRGLPENLDAVKIKEGEVTTRKNHGSVDTLFTELERSSGAKVEAAQEAVVEVVQLENPQELIGQLNRLKRLADDKRIEVRRTAMWALGRTGNVSVAPHLIKGLSDADESVVREASTALCILSRRPNGCGIPPDPTEGLSDDATDQQLKAHITDWKKRSTEKWTEWYLKIRPYDERDDRASLKKK